VSAAAHDIAWRPNPGACSACGEAGLLTGLQLVSTSSNEWRCARCGASTRSPTGPQYRFLASSAGEGLYGGAAGGGKSAGLMAMFLRWIHNPNFRGLYLRREAQYLGDAIDKTEALYSLVGGRLVRTPRIVWTFPSGATIWLNHCEHEKHVRNYDSFEFSLVAFDELTHFTQKQYLGIRARLRGTDPTLPYASRGATNPGGEGAEWVFNRWAPWLDTRDEYKGVRAESGERLWYRGDDLVPPGTPDSISRTFIGARLSDNPHIPADYRARLLQLDPVRRAQLDKGDWLVRPAAGLYFQRAWIKEWFDKPAAMPSARVRYWDLAAGGDYAAGCKYSRSAPLWYVEDMLRLRGTPHQVRQLVFNTAKQDGPGVQIYVEQDPGQAGKDQAFSYASAPELQGYTVHFRPKRTDKITSFGPFSSQCEAGLVAIVRGAWNTPFFDEAEGFPEGDYDDQCDAASGAHAVLSGSYADKLAAAMDAVKKRQGRPI
jgi:predicted phage terminase large subunit-like protein